MDRRAVEGKESHHEGCITVLRRGRIRPRLPEGVHSMVASHLLTVR